MRFRNIPAHPAEGRPNVWRVFAGSPSKRCARFTRRRRESNPTCRYPHFRSLTTWAQRFQRRCAIVHPHRRTRHLQSMRGPCLPPIAAYKYPAMGRSITARAGGAAFAAWDSGPLCSGCSQMAPRVSRADGPCAAWTSRAASYPEPRVDYCRGSLSAITSAATKFGPQDHLASAHAGATSITARLARCPA